MFPTVDVPSALSFYPGRHTFCGHVDLRATVALLGSGAAGNTLHIGGTKSGGGLLPQPAQDNTLSSIIPHPQNCVLISLISVTAAVHVHTAEGGGRASLPRRAWSLYMRCSLRTPDDSCLKGRRPLRLLCDPRSDNRCSIRRCGHVCSAYMDSCDTT
ncbi:hypothetical protein OBBRIDRAFT_157905 [Obba rivulosa]|uniref:Uncharacterized protein n=1 Tax=Obba rivulosa TaxID=1052685 RepID=A0A8E2DJ23_9APHY|nr:hypothetical protein OBBRIDRAFT_157905 [Obba rivulosa]